jgi:hypothetical protein
MRCCVKLGSLELPAENCLGTLLTTQGQQDINLPPEASRDKLFKYAKSHGVHHDSHKHLWYVQIFAVDAA